MRRAVKAIKNPRVLVAAVVLGIGLAFIISPELRNGDAPWTTTVAHLFGHALITGGPHALYDALWNPESSWKTFGTAFCKGFFVGCVSSCYSLGATTLPYMLESVLGISRESSVAIFGALCSFLTNSAANWANGRNLTDNCMHAIVCGACFDFFSFGLVTGFQANAEQEAFTKKIFEVVESLGGNYIDPGLLQTQKAILKFRSERPMYAIHDIGQDVIAQFALWIKLAGRKSGDADGEASSTTSTGPEESLPSSDPPPRASDEPNITFEEIEKEEEFHQPLAAAAESTSTDTYDPGNDDINVAFTPCTPQAKESTGMQQLYIEIPCSLEQSQHQQQNKYHNTERNTEAIKKEITAYFKEKLEKEKLPVGSFDENATVGSMAELIQLHKKQEEMATLIKEETTRNWNYIHVTTSTDGIRLCRNQNPQHSSSNEQRDTLQRQKIGEEKSSTLQNIEKKEAEPFFNPQVIGKQYIHPNEKIATVHKLITTDNKCEYQLTESEWPAFTGTMRVVGLMGAPRSGKTTLAQSILFKLGYKLSEAHATLTRIPIGIHAYVLREDNLIIVECCEGIDPPVELKNQNMSHSPYGALLLETLMYIFCMRVMYTMLFGPSMTSAIKTFAKERVYLLTLVAAMHKAARQQQVDFVLRVREEKADYEKEIEDLWNYLSVPQSQTSLYQRLLQSWVQSTKDSRLESLQALNTVTVSPLRLFQLEDNSNKRNEYESQLQAIIDIITSRSNDESKNGGLMNDAPIDSQRFKESFKFIWSELTKSEWLKQVIAKIRAEEEVETGEDSFKVTDFFKDAQRFMQNLQEHKEIVEAYNQHIKSMRLKAEKFTKLQKEEQTPELFIESVIKLADLIVAKSINLNHTKLRNEGIKLGLDGFATLAMAGNNTVVEIMALRMAIFDCNLVEKLNTPDIYNFYPQCWHLLTRLARSGFRFRILEFDLWKAVTEYLKKGQLNTPYEAEIYHQILCLLNELTDPDPSRCVPDLVRRTDVYFSRDVPLELIAFDFEKEIKESVLNMLNKVLEDPKEAQTLYNEWLTLPKKWFEGSVYVKEELESNKEKEKVEELLGTLMGRNFEILYKLIAETFSKKIVEIYHLLITKKFSERSKGIEKMRLLLWKNVADNSKHNSELFRSLLETNLIEFLIEEFIKKEKDKAISVNFPQVLSTLCIIISAEKIHKEDERVKKYIEDSCKSVKTEYSDNIHVISEYDDQRLRLAERWTLTRLRCLEGGVTEKVISYFCENTHKEGVEFLLSALLTFLVNGHNEKEKRFSETVYLSKRTALLKRTVAEMRASVEMLNDIAGEGGGMNETGYEQRPVQLAVLKTGCQFINHMLAVYYNEQRNDKKFFTDVEKNQIYPEKSDAFKLLISAAKAIYPVCTMAASKNKKDKLVQLQYFNFVLNLASASERSIHKIMLENDITNIGTVENCTHSVQIIHGEGDFLKLDVDTKYTNHHRLLVVAADFLKGNESLQTIEKNLTEQIKQLQNEITDENKARNEYLDWIRQESSNRERKRREATKETEVSVISTPVIVSSSLEMKYAIEDVPFWSPYYKHRWNGKPSYDDVKQAFQEVVDEAVLDAYVFFLLNDVHEKDAELKTVLKFFEKLANSNEKPFELRQNKLNVMKMCSFQHFNNILLNCGYRIKDGHYVTNEKEFKLDYAHTLCEQLKIMKDMNVRLLLDSQFKKVAEVLDLSKERLPLAFFNSEDKLHSAFSIREMLSRRGKLAKFPVQLRYTLVRITHRDSGDCYQAVFTPDSKVSHVFAQLRSCDMSTLYQNEDGDLNERLAMDLESFGRIVIEFKGY